MLAPPSASWRPLLAALGTAVTVRALALVSQLQSPVPLQDEGYLAVASSVTAWLESSPGAAGVENPLLLLFWHNPGYSGLVALLTVVFGDPALPLAVLQSVLGIASGWLVFALLSRVLSRPFSLVGALVVWLHPSTLYFEQQVSSVSLSMFLCAALAYNTVGLFAQPDDRKLQWRVGLTLLPLPWLGTGGLLLVPLVAATVARSARLRCVGPAVAAWLPAMVFASVSLGMLTPLNLDVPTRVALGNNPLVWVGQGSLLGNPEATTHFHDAIEAKCGRKWTPLRVRCRARSARQVVVATVAGDPTAAVRRAVFRLLETWVPDRSLADAMQSRSPGEGNSRLAHLLVALTVIPLHLGLLVGLAVAVVSSRRSLEVRFLLWSIFAWTLPVLFSVGDTSLRQAALPWIVSATLLSVATVGRRSGQERRAGWVESDS